MILEMGMEEIIDKMEMAMVMATIPGLGQDLDSAMGLSMDTDMATISGMARVMDTDLDIPKSLQELMLRNPSALPYLS